MSISTVAAVSMFDASSLEYKRNARGSASSSFVKRLAVLASAVLLIMPVSAFATTPPLPEEYEDDSSAAYCPSLSQTLKRNMRDRQTNPQGQVTELQLFFASYYDLDEEQVVSGFFGRMTQQYAIRFQREQGFPLDAQKGIVGQMTRDAIAKVCGGATPPNPGYSLSLLFASGEAPTYAPGQTISLQLKAIERHNGSAAMPSEGYNVQLYLLDAVTRETLQSGNAVYDVNSSYWQAPAFVTPQNFGKRYTVTAHLYCANSNFICGSYFPSGPTDSKGQVDIEFTFTVQSTATNVIRVTAPNGGEVFESTPALTDTISGFEKYKKDITWSGVPDSSGFDGKVLAFLDKFENGQFVNVGRIPAFAYGSIHWVVGIITVNQGCRDVQCLDRANLRIVPPGQYYVRLIDVATNSEDRSDQPFTIIPAQAGQAPSVDLKINGLDSVTLPPGGNHTVSVSWKSSGFASCKLILPEGGAEMDVLTQGEKQHTFFLSPGVANLASLTCRNSSGGSLNDVVYIHPATSASSIRVISPNGGESLDPNKVNLIKYSAVGIKSFTVMLYKNDIFLATIANFPEIALQSEINSFSAGPDTFTPYIGPSYPQDGAVYKVHLEGSRISGSGYVEDKSDAPFKFTSTPTSPFSATPETGTSPLTVLFSTTAGDEESFLVDFGDGASAVMTVSDGGAKRSATHKYINPGTYTAVLMKKYICHPSSGTSCPALDSYEVARKTVTVRVPHSEGENGALNQTNIPYTAGAAGAYSPSKSEIIDRIIITLESIITMLGK